MGESTQSRYSFGLKDSKTKTMTQAFHLEADNIPVTFLGKCQGLARFMGLAGNRAQETRRGSPLHSLSMPKNATFIV